MIVLVVLVALGILAALAALAALGIDGLIYLATGNEGKREVTGQGSLEDLILEQVGDFTLQTNEPLKAKPKDSTDSRVLTYRSSDGTEVKHIVGFVVPKYAYSAKTADSEAFADSYVESAAKPGSTGKMDLGGEPKRSDFQVKDENGKQVGRGVLLQGTQSDAVFWINGKLNASVKTPAGDGQDFYDKLPY